MSKVLILFSHDHYERSRANRARRAAAEALPDVEFVHLEQLYPDDRIDVAVEAERLLRAERIVLQFPIHWYSTPPLLKRWQDEVLTDLFYIRPECGAQLAGRPVMIAATAGNTPSAYSETGANLFSVAELLNPLRATAARCGLRWVPPFVSYENHPGAAEAKLESDAADYRTALEAFSRLRLPPLALAA